MSDTLYDIALFVLVVLASLVTTTVVVTVGYTAWRAFLKLRKRDKYLCAAIFNLSWYCLAALVLTAMDKAVPDSLTAAWFSCWTVELALLAGIKIKDKGE